MIVDGLRAIRKISAGNPQLVTQPQVLNNPRW
jgi:hypothetical protein